MNFWMARLPDCLLHSGQWQIWKLQKTSGFSITYRNDICHPGGWPARILRGGLVKHPKMTWPKCASKNLHPKVHQKKSPPKQLAMGFNNITNPPKEKSKKKHTQRCGETLHQNPWLVLFDPEKKNISLPLKDPQTDRESNSIFLEPGCVGTARQAIEGLNSSRDQPSKALPGVSKSCSSPEQNPA